VNETLVVKDYINEISKFKSISIWILYKKILGILASAIFV
jgi:hypothetical protein